MLVEKRLEHLRRLNLFNVGLKKVLDAGLWFFQEEQGSLHWQVTHSVLVLLREKHSCGQTCSDNIRAW